jgi:hypothetical protein
MNRFAFIHGTSAGDGNISDDKEGAHAPSILQINA